MTGPEHYREAIRILDESGSQMRGRKLDLADALAIAQIHATLALAAATAQSGRIPERGAAALASWSEVLQ